MKNAQELITTVQNSRERIDQLEVDIEAHDDELEALREENRALAFRISQQDSMIQAIAASLGVAYDAAERAETKAHDAEMARAYSAPGLGR